MLRSFLVQVRGIRVYDFGVSGACQGESVIVGCRSDKVHDVNCLDAKLVRGLYNFGHLDGHTPVTHDARFICSSVTVNFISSESGVCSYDACCYHSYYTDPL